MRLSAGTGSNSVTGSPGWMPAQTTTWPSPSNWRSSSRGCAPCCACPGDHFEHVPQQPLNCGTSVTRTKTKPSGPRAVYSSRCRRRSGMTRSGMTTAREGDHSAGAGVTLTCLDNASFEPEQFQLLIGAGVAELLAAVSGVVVTTGCFSALPFRHCFQDSCQKPHPLFHSSLRVEPVMSTMSPRWARS